MTWSEMVSAFNRLERGESVCLTTNHVNSVLPSTVLGPSLGLTSSGSTGTPKTVWKSWADLKAGASTSPTVRGWKWATPFGLSSFAGVQVAVQAWISGGSLVPLAGDWDKIWDILHTAQPEAISATPTFFDLLLQTEMNTKYVRPRQHCYGGRANHSQLSALNLQPAPPRAHCTFVTTANGDQRAMKLRLWGI